MHSKSPFEQFESNLNNPISNVYCFFVISRAAPMATKAATSHKNENNCEEKEIYRPQVFELHELRWRNTFIHFAVRVRIKRFYRHSLFVIPSLCQKKFTGWERGRKELCSQFVRTQTKHKHTIEAARAKLYEWHRWTHAASHKNERRNFICASAWQWQVYQAEPTPR